MILVDTSVLIDYLQTNDARLLSLMQKHGAAVCGITRAEVLCGALGAKHRQRLLSALNVLQLASIPDTLWDTVGDHLAALRAGGVTIPFPDAVIAALAIDLDIELWTRDKHFADVQRILPQLKLFQEPP
jgi:predicted nucleic acid-binding protein